MKLIVDTKWLDAISSLDDVLRLVIIDAMFSYLEGNTPVLGEKAEAIFSMLKPFIDEDKNKRERLAERSRENGKKGGRKPKTKNLSEPKKPTGFLSYLEKDEFKGRCDKLIALDKWKESHIPYIYANVRPLTQTEFAKLEQRGYTAQQICETLLQIENRKDLRKRYVNPYQTLLNWMKRNYGHS